MYSCNDQECRGRSDQEEEEYLAEKKMIYEAKKEMADKENSENFIVVVVALAVAVLVIFDLLN